MYGTPVTPPSRESRRALCRQRQLHDHESSDAIFPPMAIAGIAPGGDDESATPGGQTLLTVIAKSDHSGQRVTVSHRACVSGCSNPGFTSPASSHAAVVETPPTGDGQRAGEDHEHSPPSLRAQSLRLRGLSSAAGQTDGSDACRRPRNPRATAGECRAVPGSHMDLRSRWMFENHTQADPFLRLRDRER